MSGGGGGGKNLGHENGGGEWGEGSSRSDNVGVLLPRKYYIYCLVYLVH